MSEKLTTVKDSYIINIEVRNFPSIEDALTHVKDYILENNLFEHGTLDGEPVVRVTVLRPGAFE